MCDHASTYIYTTGGMHYNYDEVWDDYEDTVICEDCGEEVNNKTGDKPDSDYNQF